MSVENNSISRIALSGGGSKGPIILGALHYFFESKQVDFSQVTEYAGSSIGSVLCLLLLCGYKTIDILGHISSLSGSVFKTTSQRTIFDILENFGTLSLDKFIGFLFDLMKNKGWKRSPTFLEFYQRKGFESCGKTFIVTGVDLTSCSCKYYSVWSTPNMEILEAIKISCSLPFIFDKNMIDGSYLTDGGLGNNLPIEAIDNGKSRILAISITSLDPLKKDGGISSYFLRMITFPILINMFLRGREIGENVDIVTLYSVTGNDEKKSKKKREKDIVTKAIEKTFPKLSSMMEGSKIIDFEMGVEEKLDMFFVGYIQASYFKRKEHLLVKF